MNSGRSNIHAFASRARCVLAVGAWWLVLCVLHLPLLTLPYFWDELGYFIPVARDLAERGDVIPVSVPSNAHPPLVAGWLAIAWKSFGASPLVTRCAMLVFGAAAVAGTVRLTTGLGGRKAGIAAGLCVAVYPVFFAQSTLANLDLPAAAFSIWALTFFLEGRVRAAAAAFCFAVMAKEIAVLTVIAIAVWDTLRSKRPSGSAVGTSRGLSAFLWPVTLLCAWFAYHYYRTGFPFGNREYFEYNFAPNFSVRRVAAAMALRVWHTLFHLNLVVLTGSGAFAIWKQRGDWARDRIPSWAGLLATIVGTWIAALSVSGGAVLARYMIFPAALMVACGAIAIWKLPGRTPYALTALVCAAFIWGWFISPPYHAAFEDNLLYRDFVLLHRGGAEEIARYHPGRRVITAWPATMELTDPFGGYAQAPDVFEIPDFSAKSLETVSKVSGPRLLYAFSRKYEPPESLFRPGRYLRRWRPWTDVQKDYFDPKEDLAPGEIQRATGGKVAWSGFRGQQYALILVFE